MDAATPTGACVGSATLAVDVADAAPAVGAASCACNESNKFLSNAASAWAICEPLVNPVTLLSAGVAADVDPASGVSVCKKLLVALAPPAAPLVATWAASLCRPARHAWAACWAPA